MLKCEDSDAHLLEYTTSLAPHLAMTQNRPATVAWCALFLVLAALFCVVLGSTTQTDTAAALKSSVDMFHGMGLNCRCDVRSY